LRELGRLPLSLRALERAAAYPAYVGEALKQLASDVDLRLAGAKIRP
jgi:hypothetical protein